MLPDGLIHVRPRRRLALRPFKILLFVTVVMILYKGILVFHLGTEGYTYRLATLADGTRAEQIGAWIMQLDPATRAVATVLQAVLG